LQGNYRIDRAAGEPDPHVIDLNTDLSICDEFATAALPPKERRCVIGTPPGLFTHNTATYRFVFEGLGTLMEHLLISNSRHIRFANATGIQKIMRNMLAMQQNLKTITDASQDADFEKAKAYWNLFSLKPAVRASFPL
jgi:exocyst complex component 4